MSDLKCPVVQDLLINYIDGETSQETNNEIIGHLEECSDCTRIFESLKTAPVVLSSIEKTAPQKVEVMIVKKAINRLRLTAAMLIVLWILFGFGSAALGSIFGMNQKAEDGRRAFSDLVKMRRPGIFVYGSRVENHGIYSEITIEGGRRVANSTIPVVMEKARISLLGNLFLTTGLNDRFLYNKDLPFPLRPGFEFLDESEKNRKFIAGLPNGLEAEGVVSFKKYLTPKETDLMFKKYDQLTLTWVAFQAQSDAETAQSQNKGLNGNVFGFPIIYDAVEGNRPVTDDNQVQLAAEGFSEELGWLARRYEKTTGVMQYPRVDEAAGYVKKNGIMIYGGVVIGSSEAIKKLQQDENVRHIEPGEIRMLKP